MQFANCKIEVVIISCDFMICPFQQNTLYYRKVKSIYMYQYPFFKTNHRVSFAMLTYLCISIPLATIIDFSASRQY